MLDKSIVESFSKAKGLKAAYYILSISALLLSAILTVFLGHHSQDSQNILLNKNIAVILGATITFLTGLSTFWRLDRFWIRRRIFVRKLVNLRDLFHYQRLSSAEFDLAVLFSEYQNLQNTQTHYWEGVYNEVIASNETKQQNKGNE